MLQIEMHNASGRQTVNVDTDPFTIGRGGDNRLQLQEGEVSRHHSEILCNGGVWRIRDCGSRFGTWVNDVKVAEAEIKPGDRIRIGHAELRIVDGKATDTSGIFDFRQMSALLAGLGALGSSRVLDEVLAIVLDSAIELTHAERGFILLADPAGRLDLTLARGRGGITLTNAETSRRIPNEVFATGVDQMVKDLLDETLAADHGRTVALGIRHVLCTPLQVMEYGLGAVRRIGVLYLDSKEKGTLRRLEALHPLAAEAAVVIENARLYREMIEKERVAQELRVAAQIQQALLPPAYHLGSNAELAGVMRPCRAVGGDFFDYVAQPDGALNFALGDVAGKGTSAALLTAVVQGLFAAEAGSADEPGHVVTRINRSLCRRTIESRFVTAFYGRRLAGGSLCYCNAGHNAPFLLAQDGVMRLDVGGFVLGIFDDGHFETGEIQVRAGDLLVLFSDGVTEAQNPEGDEFGDARMAACLMTARDRPVREVLDAVQQELDSFRRTEPPHDDVTVMALRFR